MAVDFNTIPRLTQTEEVFTIGRFHWRHAERILDRYDGLVDWEWAQSRVRSKLTIKLNCEEAWDLRDELVEWMEDHQERRARR